MPTIIIVVCSLILGVIIGWTSSTILNKSEQTASVEQVQQLERELKNREEQLTILQRRASVQNSIQYSSPSFVRENPLTTPSREISADRVAASSIRTQDEHSGDTQATEQQDWREQARTAARRMTETRLDSLALALGLRPDQVATLRSVTSNFLDAEENSGWRAFRQINEKIDHSLNNMLSEDQKNLYAAYQERERNARVDIRTNVEYSILDVAVGLSPQQSDAVFQALASINQLESDPQFIATLGTDDRSAIRQAIQQQKKEAMSRILTPEQQRVYEGFVESQRSFGRSFRIRE